MLTTPITTADKLMRAAMEIVATDGFAAATTAAIARKAGLAEGTLYRNHKSKDALLIAVYRALKAEVFEHVIAANQDSDTVRDRYQHLWRGVWDTYQADPVAFAFAQRFGENPLSQQEGGSAHEAIVSYVAQMIADGQAQGVIRPLPSDILMTFFFPPLMSLLKQAFAGRIWTEADIDAAIEASWQAWAT
jgi:AcrR family transcriptional regulator